MLQRSFILLATGCLTTGYLVKVARADLFVLHGGGRIEGTLTNPDEMPREHYAIEIAGGGQVLLGRGQVERVVRRGPQQDEYLATAPSYPDTVEGQWKLAQWCREHHLSTERKIHLQRVIELDANHAEARRALGYSLFDGKWQTQEELMTSRGYVRHRGRWVLPQQVELDEQNRKDELAEKEWRGRIKRWTGWLTDPERSAEAQSQLSQIDDPYALPALRDWILADPEVTHRQLALDTLARFQAPAVVDVLVDVSLRDPDPELRRLALEHVGRHDVARAVGLYVRQLKSKENQTVNDAAIALSFLKDPQAIGPLIDALTTTHKFVINPPNAGTHTATFVNPNSTGGATTVPNAGLYGNNPGGLTMGGGPKVVSQKIQNQDVLDALIAITHQNFGFELRAWKAWFAAQKKSQSLDARRD